MNYEIPQFIKYNFSSLVECKFILSLFTGEEIIINLKKQTVEGDFIFVPDNKLEFLDRAYFRVKRVGQGFNEIDAIQASQEIKASSKVIKLYTSNYKDSVEDKLLILQLLTKLIEETKKLSLEPIGRRNLIYYTCFKNEGYIDLIELSIKSILARGAESQDFLIFTDSKFEGKIKARFSQFDSINIFYHVYDEQESPENGIIASTVKLNIFDWPQIDNYHKILFLDCDTLALKNCDTLFNLVKETKVISTVSSSKIPNLSQHGKEFHSLNFKEDPILETINESTESPFNAGQFLIINSEQAKSHFENMIWLLKVWPGKLFFEQSAMNRYFLEAGFLDKDLGKFFELVKTAQNNPNFLEENPKAFFAHFCFLTLNSEEKLKVINDFKTLHKI